MRRLVLFLALIWPTVLAAQMADLPALYDVTGVAADDVLNVRTAPDASGQKIGALEPSAIGIEVVKLNPARSWGQINLGETAGWVSMRFLARQPGQEAGDKIPTPMWCYGTEPFWSLEIRASEVTFSDPGMGADPITMYRQPVGQLPSSPRAALVAGDITGFISREACNDGMSDQRFGRRVDFFRTGNGGSFPLSGCCTLQD